MKLCPEFEKNNEMAPFFRICGEKPQIGSDGVEHACTLPPDHLKDGYGHKCDCGLCWSNLGDHKCDAN